MTKSILITTGKESIFYFSGFTKIMDYLSKKTKIIA